MSRTDFSYSTRYITTPTTNTPIYQTSQRIITQPQYQQQGPIEYFQRSMIQPSERIIYMTQPQTFYFPSNQSRTVIMNSPNQNSQRIIKEELRSSQPNFFKTKEVYSSNVSFIQNEGMSKSPLLLPARNLINSEIKYHVTKGSTNISNSNSNINKSFGTIESIPQIKNQNPVQHERKNSLFMDANLPKIGASYIQTVSEQKSGRTLMVESQLRNYDQTNFGQKPVQNSGLHDNSLRIEKRNEVIREVQPAQNTKIEKLINSFDNKTSALKSTVEQNVFYISELETNRNYAKNSQPKRDYVLIERNQNEIPHHPNQIRQQIIQTQQTNDSTKKLHLSELNRQRCRESDNDFERDLKSEAIIENDKNIAFSEIHARNVDEQKHRVTNEEDSSEILNRSEHNNYPNDSVHCDLNLFESIKKDELGSNNLFPERLYKTLDLSSKPHIHSQPNQVLKHEVSKTSHLVDYEQNSQTFNTNENLKSTETGAHKMEHNLDKNDNKSCKIERQKVNITLENIGNYCGEMFDGKLDGYGILSATDKSILYEGEFFDNHFNGLGIVYNNPIESSESMKFEGRLPCNWIRFEGSFVDSKKEGFGELHFKDGSRYFGEFLNDNAEGKGTYFLRDGDEYSGIWVQNELTNNK